MIAAYFIDPVYLSGSEREDPACRTPNRNAIRQTPGISAVAAQEYRCH
jgi:hypothetical protein